MTPESVTFQMTGRLKTAAYATVEKYILSPGQKLTSREIYLNGNLLKLNEDGSVPALLPFKMKGNGSIVLHRYEMGFWVFKDVTARTCK